MQKETACNFWRRFLALANHGEDVSVVNPTRDFTVSVRAGEYDHMPTEQYDTVLSDHEQLSAIWHDRPQAPAGDILLNALHMTSINSDRLEELSKILADCSAETMYGLETEPDPLPHDIGERAMKYPEISRLTPKDIYTHLCQRVRGQDEAKKATATVVYNHLNGRRTSALFCGPSGCGKTEIWRHLAKELPGLIRIVDASRLSADGWKGSLHLRDIFDGIPASDLNTSGLIVVLDEADKICCEAAVGAGGTNYNALVQNSLLKMLDGDVIEFGTEDNSRKAFSVDCSRVSVVLLGAFERLLEGKSSNSGGIGFGSPVRKECDYSNTDITHNDLINAGMRREITGRLNRIVPLRPLTAEDYKAILMGPVLEDLQSSRKCRIYDDIKEKLIAAGMPRSQIAFIHDADTDEQKKALFAKVRSGQVRVLIGSTQKMGAGTNVQDRLIASHDLDCPWRPRDLTQRAGRIIRQGNGNKTVHIYRYVTESTFDSYLWQTVEAKQKFISQVMTSRTPLRSCEDVDETALSFAEIKALCAGDPRIKERMELDVEVSKLRIMKADYQSKRFRLEDDVSKRFPAQISQTEAMIAGIQKDMDTLAAHPHPGGGFAGMEVQGRTYTEKDKAGEALMDAVAAVSDTEPVEIGSYRGFAVTAWMNTFGEYRAAFKGVVSYTIELGESATGNITRIDNALAKLPEHLKEYQAKLADLNQQMESAKAEAAKPFAMETELQQKSARLAELDAALNLGHKGGEDAAA